MKYRRNNLDSIWLILEEHSEKIALYLALYLPNTGAAPYDLSYWRNIDQHWILLISQYCYFRSRLQKELDISEKIALYLQTLAQLHMTLAIGETLIKIGYFLFLSIIISDLVSRKSVTVTSVRK